MGWRPRARAKAAARRRLAHWTAKGASASAVTPASTAAVGTLIDQARSNAEGEGGGGGGGWWRRRRWLLWRRRRRY